MIFFSGKLKELTVCTWFNCDKTPEDLLANAIARLEKVKMTETSLDRDQLTAIFTTGAKSQSLTEADFSGSQVHNVSGSLIGKFATNLTKFCLGNLSFVFQ